MRQQCRALLNTMGGACISMPLTGLRGVTGRRVQTLTACGSRHCKNTMSAKPVALCHAVNTTYLLAFVCISPQAALPAFPITPAMPTAAFCPLNVLYAAFAGWFEHGAFAKLLDTTARATTNSYRWEKRFLLSALPTSRRSVFYFFTIYWFTALGTIFAYMRTASYFQRTGLFSLPKLPFSRTLRFGR